MTLNEFVAKYEGKGVEWDKSYGPQCVDLMRQYINDVLSFPQPKGVVGAKDFWTNFETDFSLHNYFTKVPNTPSGVPERGALMIWGAEYGKFGHVAIVTDANVNTFNCFSQNDPAGTLSRVRRYNSYKGVLGWLHPRTVENSRELQWLRQMFLEYNAVDVYKPEGEIRGKVQEVFDGFKKYNELSKKIETLEKDLAGARGEAAENEERLRISERSLAEVRKEVDDLQEKVSRRDTEISELLDKVNALQKSIDPETKIIVDKEVWDRVNSRKTTDRLTDREIYGAAFKRFFAHFSPARIYEAWDKDKQKLNGGEK